jgi:hypothetical protein
MNGQECQPQYCFPRTSRKLLYKSGFVNHQEKLQSENAQGRESAHHKPIQLRFHQELDQYHFEKSFTDLWRFPVNKNFFKQWQNYSMLAQKNSFGWEHMISLAWLIHQLNFYLTLGEFQCVQISLINYFFILSISWIIFNECIVFFHI